MNMSVRSSYNQALTEIQRQILQMGNLVSQALDDALTALETGNEELAAQVIFGDPIIDNLQITIEDKTVELIALQQPIAKDLRILSTALKMTTDLERIGDHAKKIAKLVPRLEPEPLPLAVSSIAQVGKQDIDMIQKVLKAYVNLDAQLALEVIQADSKVDDICDSCKRVLLEYMLADKNNISQGNDLNKIIHRLERVGDHCTNLAEWVIYLTTGRRIQQMEEEK